MRQFWNITSGIYATYYVQIMLLFVYTTTHKRFVIFTCRYFKLSWNTTALSQSNCRNFWCSSITGVSTRVVELCATFYVHLFAVITLPLNSYPFLGLTIYVYHVPFIFKYTVENLWWIVLYNNFFTCKFYSCFSCVIIGGGGCEVQRAWGIFYFSLPSWGKVLYWLRSEK